MSFSRVGIFCGSRSMWLVQRDSGILKMLIAVGSEEVGNVFEKHLWRQTAVALHGFEDVNESPEGGGLLSCKALAGAGEREVVAGKRGRCESNARDPRGVYLMYVFNTEFSRVA